MWGICVCNRKNRENSLNKQLYGRDNTLSECPKGEKDHSSEPMRISQRAICIKKKGNCKKTLEKSS